MVGSFVKWREFLIRTSAGIVKERAIGVECDRKRPVGSVDCAAKLIVIEDKNNQR